MRWLHRIVEVTHAAELSDHDWYDALGRAASANLSFGMGGFALEVDYGARPESRVQRLSVDHLGLAGSSDIPAEFHATLPEAQLRELYSQPVNSVTGRPDIEELEHSLTSANEVVGREMADAVVVNGVVGTRVCIVGTLCPRPVTHRRRTLEALETLAAHLRVAHELRLDRTECPEPRTGDVVVGARGSMLELPSEVRDTAAVALFRAISRDLEIRRRRLRTFSPKESAFLWEELRRSGYRVFEHQDAGGRRYVLFRREPGETRERHLSETELRVLSGIAEGLSNKAIAFETGLALSTVATHIKNASSKLGARNRFELALLARARRGTMRGRSS